MDLHNKKCAFSTLEATAKVLPALLRDGRKQFLDTVVLLVDTQKGLYNGQKAMWTHMPGAPEVRKKRDAYMHQWVGESGAAGAGGKKDVLVTMRDGRIW